MALCVLLLFHVNFRQYGNIMITLVSPIWLHKTHPFSILLILYCVVNSGPVWSYNL